MVQAWWVCVGGACHTCSSHSTVTDRVFNGAPCVVVLILSSIICPVGQMDVARGSVQGWSGFIAVIIWLMWVVTGRILRRDFGDANDGWDAVTTV